MQAEAYRNNKNSYIQTAHNHRHTKVRFVLYWVFFHNRIYVWPTGNKCMLPQIIRMQSAWTEIWHSLGPANRH